MHTSGQREGSACWKAAFGVRGSKGGIWIAASEVLFTSCVTDQIFAECRFALIFIVVIILCN